MAAPWGQGVLPVLFTTISQPLEQFLVHSSHSINNKGRSTSGRTRACSAVQPAILIEETSRSRDRIDHITRTGSHVAFTLFSDFGSSGLISWVRDNGHAFIYQTLGWVQDGAEAERWGVCCRELKHWGQSIPTPNWSISDNLICICRTPSETGGYSSEQSKNPCP